MLRALLIRQAFLLLDLLLVALVAFIAFQVVTTSLRGTGQPVGSGVGDAGPHTVTLAHLGNRDDYRDIENSGLFGDAARSRQDEEPPPAPPPPAAVEDEVSELPLRLWGTVSLESPESPLATAVIELTRGGGPGGAGRRVYFVGDEIADGVEVREIHYKRVRLFNPTLRRHEWLVREEAPARAAPAVRRTAGPAVAPRQVSGPSVTVDSNQLYERLQQEGPEVYAQMMASVRVATDDNGEPLGLTAEGIGSVALASEMGFQEGDILQQINGRPVTSPNELMPMLMQFQGVDTFRVSVLRNGSPQMLTISLR